MAGLSPVEIVALSKCVKEKEVTDARAQIPEASAHTVNFTVHVQGNLTRAGGVAAMTARVEASSRPADLTHFDVCCAVLRQLKIGPKRLETALRSVAAQQLQVDEELLKVFQQVGEDFPKTTPARDLVTPARSGNVSVNVNVARV